MANSRIMLKLPIEMQNSSSESKPSWLKKTLSANDLEIIALTQKTLRENRLITVCEEASCPNLTECFSQKTATFMILGRICTRRCSFCDVSYGKPDKPDKNEVYKISEAVEKMGLNYVVITSVDRDDLQDGGASHFIDVIRYLRKTNNHLKIETLIPDFRGRWQTAFPILIQELPDVLNHNIETVPRLYKTTRPGASYKHSLELLKKFKTYDDKLITKSGIMVGLGENNEEILEVLHDLRDNFVDHVTIGQYLQPSRNHAEVKRYVTPDEFEIYAKWAKKIGFSKVSSGPLVRSSYHAGKN